MRYLHCNSDRLTRATHMLVANDDGEIVAQFNDVGGLNAYLSDNDLMVGAYLDAATPHLFAIFEVVNPRAALDDDVPA